jgi:hypothetical protein
LSRVLEILDVSEPCKPCQGKKAPRTWRLIEHGNTLLLLKTVFVVTLLADWLDAQLDVCAACKNA